MSVTKLLANNPLLKKMFLKAFKDMLTGGTVGIYAFINENNEVDYRECKQDPFKEIENLKKVIYNG